MQEEQEKMARRTTPSRASRCPPVSLRVSLTAVCGILLWASESRASELVEVLPLTDRILMVHFDDGTVTPAKSGQDHQSGDVVSVDPLDRARAATADAYRISSTDDPAYATAQQPSSVGRKSKGTEFSNHCDTWAGQCVNSAPDRALEHWLYLFLPSPLQRGKTYRIDTGDLAQNTSSTTLSYDETRLRSEAIHVNLVAYSTRSQGKYGYIYHWLGDRGGLDLSPIVGRPCHLVRTSDGKAVFSSTVGFRKSKDNVETGQAADTPRANFLGADVAECDFSSFNTPDEYVLSVDGVGCSFAFRIAEDALRQPFQLAMKGIFIQRSGIPISAAHAQGFTRPAPHNPGVTPGFAGQLKYTTTRLFDVSARDASAADKAIWEAGILGDIDTWGWYQDAGDWDAYFSHSAIPALLLTLFELNPDHFTDGELNIPESGNGIPDLLDEARWLLRFYHRTRHAILDAGYGTGGVGGARVMGDLWGKDQPGGIVAGSWQDTARTWVVSGEDPWITYRYAALAAHFGQALQGQGLADPEGIDWRKEAEDAWTWAQSNTRPGDGTGHGYSLQQLRMYAAVALYRLTGDETYHTAFKEDFAATGATHDADSHHWLMLYSMLPADQVDQSIRSKCIASLGARATSLLASTAYDRATRWGGDFYMPMFLGHGSTPLIADGALAIEVLSDLSADAKLAMKTRVYTTADYFLGTNPLNMTWITGLGPRHPTGPFHLDWSASGAPSPPAGIIPYGPVATARDWMAQPPEGPWSSNWPNSDLHPADIEQWPGHERWFDQRTGISSCEYTVHQTTVVAAVVYGSLLEQPSTAPPTDGGVPRDGATPGGDDAGVDAAGDGTDAAAANGDGAPLQGGCGCQSAGGPGPAWAIIAVLFGLSLLARRLHPIRPTHHTTPSRWKENDRRPEERDARRLQDRARRIVAGHRMRRRGRWR